MGTHDMNHRLSRTNVLLALAILMLLAGSLVLTERRMSYANTMGKLAKENKTLEAEITELDVIYLSTVNQAQRALISSGELETEEAPTYAYRSGGTGVALVARGR